ncbi:MAG: hypothetical protein AAGI46_10975 [Planctomycetota bacterium]
MKFFSPIAWLTFLVRGIVGTLLLGGWILAAAAVHVVVIDGPPGTSVDGPLKGWPEWRLVIVPKQRLGVSWTYVDTRSWSADDADEHEILLARLESAGKDELVERLRSLPEDSGSATADETGAVIASGR